MIWLYIISALSVSRVVCDYSFDMSRIRIRVFPAENQTIAGVFQVTHMNYLNLLEYAFNASEARRLCLSLGVNIASKSQVEEALSRGLETCRFGWVDEHFAVIPRNTALSTCGQNRTGLVTWRAAVTQKFDVFCFNESDAEAQLQNTTPDSLLNGSDRSGQTRSPSAATSSNQNILTTSSSSLLSSSSSTPNSVHNEAETAPFFDHAHGSFGAKAILIASTCAVLLIAIIILVFIKLRRSGVQGSDKKQTQDCIETKEWTCMKGEKETKTAAQEDERIEVTASTS